MFLTHVELAALLSMYGFGAWLAVWLIAFVFARAAGKGRLVSWLAVAGGLALMLFAVAFVAPKTLNAPYLEVARTHCASP